MMLPHKIPAHRPRYRCVHCGKWVPPSRKDRFCREKCRAEAIAARREARRQRNEAVAGQPGALEHVEVCALPPDRTPTPREVRV